jgi:hypothetical protein
MVARTIAFVRSRIVVPPRRLLVERLRGACPAIVTTLAALAREVVTET